MPDQSREIEPLICPKCTGVMKASNTSSVPTCASCHGVWLVVSRYGSSLDSAGGIDVWTELLLENGESIGFTCPGCKDGQLLSSRCKDIELEWCKRCKGVYLDKGELEAVRAIKSEQSSVLASVASDAAGEIIGRTVGELFAEAMASILEHL